MQALETNATGASTRSALTREEMIMEHLPQVRLVARRIHQTLPGNVSLDDLVSAGVIGLIAAIDRFDSSLNVKLKTYAEFKIRGAILDSLRTADWASRPQRRRARMIDAAVAELEAKLFRTPTEEEIVAELGITVDEYRQWSSEIHGLSVGSLNNTNSDEDGRNALQFVASEELLPSDVLEQSALKELVATAMSRMPQVERTILDMYYHQEMTLRDIAREMKLHESRISQLKTQAVNRLRSLLASRWPNRGAMVAAKVA